MVQAEHLEPNAIRRALELILTHHDALRLRLKKNDGTWNQRVADLTDKLSFTSHDIAKLSEEKQQALIESTCTELQASLNLTHGPMLRMAHFDCGPNLPDRLFCTLHHLVIDELSASIFWEDFESAYKQAQTDLTIKLPPKTTSFLKWSTQLEALARSAKVQATRSRWLELPWCDIKPLPVDFDAIPDCNINEVADAHHIFFSQRESTYILRPDGDYRPEDLLLAALARTLVKWTQSPAILMDQIGHGRADLEDTDLSRTVGFLLSYRPLVLTIPASHPSRSVLPSAVEQIGRLPEGYTFDLLRCYTKDELVKESFKKLPRAEVLFNLKFF